MPFIICMNCMFLLFLQLRDSSLSEFSFLHSYLPHPTDHTFSHPSNFLLLFFFRCPLLFLPNPCYLPFIHHLHIILLNFMLPSQTTSVSSCGLPLLHFATSNNHLIHRMFFLLLCYRNIPTCISCYHLTLHQLVHAYFRFTSSNGHHIHHLSSFSCLKIHTFSFPG